LEDKDKKDWSDFTKNLKNLHDKDSNISYENKNINLVKKIDLHGFSLEKANKTVENFINQSFDLGCNKLIVITGKGSRSKTYQDPYRSEKMSVLKYSVPEYIKGNNNLLNKIYKITEATQKDGGDGAFYVYLKKKIIK
tara:strand:- start:687 stop:1100 length:414 start_codon:yes stop_codon:yes gene_type:complete